jgi:hypothetical protein
MYMKFLYTNQNTWSIKLIINGYISLRNMNKSSLFSSYIQFLYAIGQILLFIFLGPFIDNEKKGNRKVEQVILPTSLIHYLGYDSSCIDIKDASLLFVFKVISDPLTILFFFNSSSMSIVAPLVELL